MEVGPGHAFRRHPLQVRGEDATLRAREVLCHKRINGMGGGDKGGHGQITVTQIIGEEKENVRRGNFRTAAGAACTGSASGAGAATGSSKEGGQGSKHSTSLLFTAFTLAIVTSPCNFRSVDCSSLNHQRLLYFGILDVPR